MTEALDGYEFQEMSAQQKANFIQKRLDETPPVGTIESLQKLSIKLIDPDSLWPSFSKTKPISDHGIIRGLTSEKSIGRRKSKGAVVEMSTQDPRGTFYVWFGVDAIDVTKDEQMIIDCSRVENPARGGAQGILLPGNMFIEKAG